MRFYVLALIVLAGHLQIGVKSIPLTVVESPESKIAAFYATHQAEYADPVPAFIARGEKSDVLQVKPTSITREEGPVHLLSRQRRQSSAAAASAAASSGGGSAAAAASAAAASG